MRQIDDPKFRSILASFGEVYGKPISPQLASLWWESLKDLPIELVEAGAKSWIRHGKQFPRPAQVREMVKETERATPEHSSNPRQTQEPDDHLLFFANRMFLKHLFSRNGLRSAAKFSPGVGPAHVEASSEFLAARQVVRDLVEEFSGYIREGDDLATPAAFIDLFARQLNRVSPIAPKVMTFFTRSATDERAAVPFARSMGRELHSAYARGTV
jgi:hypothetical protein